MTSIDDVLEHFGVRGMRWGVRKDDSSPRRPEKRGPSEDWEKASGNLKVAKGSGSRALSNKELQEVVTRMNLEQQYARLTATPSNRERISKGFKRTQSFLKGAGTTAKVMGDAVQFAASPAGQMIAERLGADVSGFVNSPAARTVSKFGGKKKK